MLSPKVAVQVAVPPTIATLKQPMLPPPSDEKATTPVASAGETVAVNVTGCPIGTGFGDAVRVVVVGGGSNPAAASGAHDSNRSRRQTSREPYEDTVMMAGSPGKESARRADADNLQQILRPIDPPLACAEAFRRRLAKPPRDEADAGARVTRGLDVHPGVSYDQGVA